MEARELRIGNWVYKIENGESGLYDVSSGERIDYIDALSESTAYLEFEPIPLTPEWLNRFGFENKSQTTDYYFNLGSFIIGGTGKRLFPSIHSESGLESFGNEIECVHQLQNLYFALTGKELKFKKP